MEKSELTLTTNDSLRIREENINRNKRFLANLGFGEPGSSFEDDPHMEKEPKTHRNEHKSNSEDKPGDQIRRSKRLEELTCDEPRKCDDCKSTKIFRSRKAFNIHKNNYCVMSKDYIPDQFRLSKTRHYENFLLQERCLSTSEDNIVVVNQPLFNVDDEVADNEDNIDANDLVEAINDHDPSLDNKYIDSFKFQQEKLCNRIFGDKLLECKDINQLPIIFNEHLHHSTDAKRRKLDLYNFIAAKGLSRDDGDDLLKLVNSFNPSLPTPKSFKSLETGIKNEVSLLFDYAEIEIPWIESWKMDKLPGCPPVKIYVRSMFQIISYMLVDPELMLIWQNHVQLSYKPAVDRDGFRVFTNVMNSPWAEETERLIREKDANGYLLPLIFYTDGVQVSAHARNKVTPVMITLGNFSDELMQKDISKRIVAYLPNFRGMSKDNLLQHLMKTLKIKKTKVRLITILCALLHFDNNVVVFSTL